MKNRIVLLFAIVIIAAVGLVVLGQKFDPPPPPIYPDVDFHICGGQVMNVNDQAYFTQTWTDEGCTDFYFKSVGSPYVYGYGTRITING